MRRDLVIDNVYSMMYVLKELNMYLVRDIG